MRAAASMAAMSVATHNLPLACNKTAAVGGWPDETARW
jgi:hypothetical protein